MSGSESVLHSNAVIINDFHRNVNDYLNITEMYLNINPQNAHYYLWFKHCVLRWAELVLHEPLAPPTLDGTGLVPLTLNWRQPSEGY